MAVAAGSARGGGGGFRFRGGGHLDDGAEGRIDVDGLALRREDLAEGALERGGQLGGDLLRLDLAEGLIEGDAVAGLLEPLEDGALGDALAKLGHGDGGHQ